MRDLLRRHLQDSGLIPPGARVLVGYSGGADSTALLHLLHELEIDVVAGHLHHGMRPEADDEMARCAAFCDSLGLPFASGRADVPRMAEDLGIGLEEAGRHARYGFFDQVARQTECQLIATAHTRTDQVETVLMNLARGTGLTGLGGIPPRRGNIVRPLLPFSREETQAYCGERGLWKHDDPANADDAFTRARIRRRIVPELLQVNPAFEANVARAAELIREEDGFLNGMAAAALEQAEVSLNGDLDFLTRDVEIGFRRDVLGGLPAVLFRRAVRLATEALGGQLDAHQTQTVLHGLQALERGSVTAEGGRVVLEWTADRLHVRDASPTVPFRYPLTVPGETESDEFGWCFTAFREEGDTPAVRRSLTAYLQPGEIVGQLHFRTWREGDTLRPLGFEGSRKIADLMSEARLTEAAKRRLPIVCDMVGPLWIPGICQDGRAAANAPGERLVIRFEALGTGRST